MTFDTIWSKFGGRKLAFGILCLAALIAGLFLEVSDGMYETFMWGVVGIYIAMNGGNGLEHVAAGLSKASKLVSASKPEPNTGAEEG